MGADVISLGADGAKVVLPGVGVELGIAGQYTVSSGIA